jgi:hypothetical protein
MKASLLYRIAAGILVLFFLGHTFGFRQTNPPFGVDAVVAAMQSVHFDLQGSSRTYWDLYSGLGFSSSAYLLFFAVLAWQLGGLPAATLASMRVITWAFAVCFAAVTIVCVRYMFIIPAAFCAATTVCLAAAARRSGVPARPET